jgi:hypothetical protein
MSWKKRLRMLFAKEAIVFKKKDTPYILQNFIDALIKETEQRIIKEFEIIHIAGWFVDGIDFEDDILPLIKGE